MRIGDDAAAAAEGDDGRIDRFRELQDLLACMDRAAADKDHRPLAGCDQRRRILDAVRVGERRGEAVEHLCRAGRGALGEDVPRHFQRDGAAAPRQHFLKGARDHCGRDIGVFDALRPFHESAQGRELVRHLVQVTTALAEELRRHLPSQAQHRLVAAERGEHRSARIEHAGAGHHAEHAHLAARARIAIGHVAAGLLMPGADHLQLGLVEGIEQPVHLCAGQAEHRIDAMGHKPAHDCFAAGHYRHVRDSS